MFQSNEPVQFANGVVDYMTVGFGHDNDSENYTKNVTIKQGDFLCRPGTAIGYAWHTHIFVIQGTWADWCNGGYRSAGFSSANSGGGNIKPTEALFLDTTFSDDWTQSNRSCYYPVNKVDWVTLNESGIISATPTCNHDYKTIKNNSGTYVAVCKNCGNEYQLGEINTADAGIYKTTAKIILNSAPYKESQVGNEIAKGTSFTVVGSVLNAYGNKWYQTKEGRWIYKNYLTRTGDLPASEDKLSISGANYPSSLAVGNIFIIYGTVSSERSNIKSLTVGVYDEYGNEKTGRTVSPNATSYDIHKVDVDIRFDWLTDGTYYYRITATNSSETVRLLNKKFTVGTGKSASSAPAAESASFVNRGDGIWYWPLPVKYYNSFSDWAGCPGNGTCTFCNQTHPAWGDGYHTGQAYGHNGFDVWTENNRCDVYAAAAGTAYCSSKSANGGRGYYIVVEHPLGNGWSYYSYYQHLSDFSVSNGTSVMAGQTIGKVGNTGGDYGIHLHFGMVLGKSGLGINAPSSLEGKGWVLSSGFQEGRILVNPALNSPAGFPTGLNEVVPPLKAHAGSVMFTFDKSKVTAGSDYAEETSAGNAAPTAATITEGYYTLTPACAPNMRLDVSGSEKGANVWIWTSNGSDPQTFRFTGTDSGYYVITSKYSGMVLDVWGASTESGTNVAQHPAADYFNASSGINQQWMLVDAGGGYYEIISRMSANACLDVNGAGNTEQTNVQIWERNGTDAQKWKLTFVADSAPIHTHSLTKTPAKAATCTTTGNSAYWYCSGCNKYFSDASGENEIALAQTKTNALGHSYANGKCTRCGAADPNYKKPAVNVCFTRQTVYSQGQFTDVPANQWFTSGVASAFELGLMKGNSASTFNPYGDVTISEAITMAARIHSIYTNGSETIRAAGTGEQWYQPYLDYAYENDIIKYAYYNCDVSQRATRAQFAEIFARALPDKALSAINSVGDNAIPDVSASDSYASYVYKLYRAGILAGSDVNGTFHPATFITRAESATIVSRMASSDNRVSLTLN